MVGPVDVGAVVEGLADNVAVAVVGAGFENTCGGLVRSGSGVGFSAPTSDALRACGGVLTRTPGTGFDVCAGWTDGAGAAMTGFAVCTGCAVDAAAAGFVVCTGCVVGTVMTGLGTEEGVGTLERVTEAGGSLMEGGCDGVERGACGFTGTADTGTDTTTSDGDGGSTRVGLATLLVSAAGAGADSADTDEPADIDVGVRVTCRG